MTDYRHRLRRAADAARIFPTDPEQAQELFDRVFSEAPDDGAIHLHYADAMSAIGDRETAYAHYLKAESRCWDPAWKARARAGMQRSAQAETASNSVAVSSQFLPSALQLDMASAVFLERENRSLIYEACSLMLEQAVEMQPKLSLTLPVASLLQSWNFAWYQKTGPRFDGDHFRAIEDVILQHESSLRGYRERTIDSFCASDLSVVQDLFRDFESVVRRVGAAKALHLWAPGFFPLWDNPIAEAYGFDFRVAGSKSEDYCRFMTITQEQLRQLRRRGVNATLKTLDEFNYVVFTKKWMPV